MRTRILTLRFSTTLGGFDDTPLHEFLRERDLLSLREHVVVVDDLPWIACVVTWRDRVAARAAPRVDAAAPAAPVPEVAAHAADPLPTNATSAPVRSGPATAIPELLQGLTEEQRHTFEIIRRWRSRKARDEGAPPYVVLTNRQLVEVVRPVRPVRPATDCRSATSPASGSPTWCSTAWIIGSSSRCECPATSATWTTSCCSPPTSERCGDGTMRSASSWPASACA